MKLRNRPGSLAALSAAGAIGGIVLLAVLFGAVWGFGEYLDYSRRCEEIRAHHLANLERQCRDRVDFALTSIRQKQLRTEERVMRETRQRTYEAHGMAQALYEQYKDSLSDAELRDLVREALRGFRYNSRRGYFFATAMNGVEQLFADRPEVEGKNLLDMRDTEGHYVIRDMLAIARTRGEGEYRYTWTMPGEEGANHEKVAYIKFFKPFGWIIGTGAYVEDMELTVKVEVLDALRSYRFGNDDYLFVLSYDGVFLAHVDPDVEGRNMLDHQDEDGVLVVRDLIELAQTGGGVKRYKWKLPDQSDEQKKISYVGTFGQWDWVVGAGVPWEELDALVTADVVRLRRGMMKKAGWVLGLLVLSMVAALLLANRVNRRLREGLKEFNTLFQHAATAREPLDTEPALFMEFREPAGLFSGMIQERERALRAEVLGRERMESLHALSRKVGRSQQEIVSEAMEEAVRLTGSQGGYLHLVGEDGETLYLHHWSRDVFSVCTADIREHYPLKEAGIWADSIRTGKAVIHNDYQGQEGKQGFPEGHFPLKRHLGVPVYDNGVIVAAAGVGNKEGPYDETDGLQVLMTMQGMWSMIRLQRDREALEESENKFRRLAENAQDMIYRMTLPDGRYEYLSPACVTITGFTPQEFYDNPLLIRDILHPLWVDYFERVWADLNKGIVSPTYEYQIIHRQGDARWVFQRNVLIRDRDGEPVALESIVTDITDRKEAEQRLREGEEKLRSILQSTPMGVILCSYEPDGKLILMGYNPAAESILGIDMEPLLGMETEEAFPSLAGSDLLDSIREVCASGEPWYDPHAEYMDDKVKGVFELHAFRASSRTLALQFRDVAASKQAEDALRASENTLAGIFRAAPVGIGIVENEQIIKANEQLCAMSGYAEEEILGREAAIFAPSPEDYQRVRTEMIGKLEDNFIGTMEVQWVRKDESVIDVLLRSTRLEGISAENTVIFTALDITNSKATREALARSEVRFRRMFENAPLAYQSLDPDGRILDVNSRWLDFTGFAKDQILGRDLGEFTDKEHALRLGEWFTQLKEQGQNRDVELPLLAKDGSQRCIFLIGRAQYDEEGKVQCVHCIFQDITGMREKEREAAGLRRLLGDIVDSMPSVLACVDKKCRVTLWNLEAARLSGVPAEEALGRDLGRVFPRLAPERDNILRAMANKTIFRHEKSSWRDQGHTVFADVTIYPVGSDGDAGAVIRMDDATQRVRMEEVLIQSEKMLSVGGLAAGMAHEINNPLAAITGNLQVILQRLSGDLDANHLAAKEVGLSLDILGEYMKKRDLPRMFQSIREAAERSAAIVGNMLSFSRKNESQKAPNSLARLLDQAVELAANDYDLKRSFDFRDIKIVRHYDPETPEVMCGTGKIQQVFLNILGNGAQAMASNPDGPPPRFTLSVAPDQEGGWVRVDISDNGPGMSESVRKRVFEPFFTTKNMNLGTGLGLSVAFFIITQNHGGTMSVASEPGKGATFTIRLPVTEA